MKAWKKKNESRTMEEDYMVNKIGTFQIVLPPAAGTFPILPPAPPTADAPPK